MKRHRADHRAVGIRRAWPKVSAALATILAAAITLVATRQTRSQAPLPLPTSDTDPRLPALVPLAGSDPTHRRPLTHVEWVDASMREMGTIRPGMTRRMLKTVFRGEGGISTRTHRLYVYRGCPYFKVEVTFAPVGEPDHPYSESDDDQIVTISKPFLEYMILD
jgi:hypothetical protein